ncbi:MAG: hypothetical protein HFI98_00275 [Lachnospiraceae bacterium]|jgi:hypothetical protein|nr:hypothetical protein [Lachnospiraceae bacterium]MCI9095567.1 hypothetical protein [Lachnospiraceae bacterium]MCI9202574.1 hypothetical protein [Lachnospiraceae bacterium]MCI9333186.1 hypothetical protein [Lachnospiraceae bacterium]
MTCKEVEKTIPLFLEDDLDTDDLREFLEHIEQCKECEEELSIQFLVLEGLSRLEAGNVFDLKNELDFQMEEAEHALWRRENMQRFLYLLEGLVALTGTVLIILLFALL